MRPDAYVTKDRIASDPLLICQKARLFAPNNHSYDIAPDEKVLLGTRSKVSRFGFARLACKLSPERMPHVWIAPLSKHYFV